MTLPQPSSGSQELSEEIRNTFAARQELGREMDDELAGAFARHIQAVIAEEVSRQVGSRSRDETKLRDWQKEMYAITLGCGIPIVAIAAWVGGLLGVLVVTVLLALMSIAVTWRRG